MAGAASGGRAPHLPVVRAAVAAGLNTVYAVAAGLGLAAGIIVLALVRPTRAAAPAGPERATVATGASGPG